jgi:hypothetical protein
MEYLPHTYLCGSKLNPKRTISSDSTAVMRVRWIRTWTIIISVNLSIGAGANMEVSTVSVTSQLQGPLECPI